MQASAPILAVDEVIDLVALYIKAKASLTSKREA